MLDHIRIVLISTSHPGNIGAAARAMKTMGLSQLYLVAPETDFPHPKAAEMSSGALDVLEGATVVSELGEAIQDCGLIIGTSARTRKIPWPLLSPRELNEKLKQAWMPASAGMTGGAIAIIFGREQSGLTNEELSCCHCHLQIPANPDYSSLNLAAAVQIIAYECRLASMNVDTHERSSWDHRLASADEMAHFFQHLEQVLIDIDFLKVTAPRKLMTRLRRFFLRAEPDVMEVNLLRGILTAMKRRISEN